MGNLDINIGSVYYINDFIIYGGLKMAEKIYELKGIHGKRLEVYEDKVVIKTKVSVGSVLMGTALNGEKTIYFSDCVGIQFKKAGIMIGYLEFETASNGATGGGGANFYNENSFNWDITNKIPNKKMIEVAEYCKKQIEEYKTKNNNAIVNEISSADELKKFKDLLDMGVITQEEFEAKKKQLLGL